MVAAQLVPAEMPPAPFQIDLKIDRDSDAPLYRQIAEPLERAIVSGVIPAGSLIEDEVSMAKRLEVSRPTARRALQDLVDRGLVARKRGVGTRVNPGHIHRRIGLTSLDEDLRNAGFETRTEVLNYQVVLAGPEEACILHCEEGAEVVRIQRLRWASGEPLALLTNLIPAGIAPSITDLANASLYDSLRTRGVEVVSASQNVSARNSSERESELLEMVSGDAVLTVQRWAFDPLGTVVEYGEHIYNPALHSLSFNSVGTMTSTVHPQGFVNTRN